MARIINWIRNRQSFLSGGDGVTSRRRESLDFFALTASVGGDACPGRSKPLPDRALTGRRHLPQQKVAADNSSRASDNSCRVADLSSDGNLQKPCSSDFRNRVKDVMDQAHVSRIVLCYLVHNIYNNSPAMLHETYTQTSEKLPARQCNGTGRKKGRYKQRLGGVKAVGQDDGRHQGPRVHGVAQPRAHNLDPAGPHGAADRRKVVLALVVPV